LQASTIRKIIWTRKKKVSMSEEELFLMRKLYLWKMNEKPF